MNIEKQVVNRKLAKELEEAGYLQEGLWWYDKDGILFMHKEHDKGRFIVAPTVAELGEKLKRHDQQMPVWDSLSKKWLRTCKDYKVREDTEVNARAKMWLYLKKKGVIKWKNGLRE